MTDRFYPRARLALIAALALAAVLALQTGTTAGRAAATVDSSGHVAAAPVYVPSEVVVRYTGPPLPGARSVLKTMGVRASAEPPPEPGSSVLRLPPGETVSEAIARLRSVPGVVYAVPNYVAHLAGSWIPDDPGRTHKPGGWQKTQWNFLAGAGVNAPIAWANLRVDHRGGGRGVVVAVIDTGVAYRNWRNYVRSPDFTRTRFIDPHDFLANNSFPLDRGGHGTFIAGEIAEATNNHVALTGLAYGATIMPLRVLAADGFGDASTIARGIRYAVAHHAQIINLSLEFPIGIRPSDIPQLVSAIRFAERHKVLVVSAAGNDETNQIAYPAALPGVLAVGATTADRCLAWYSNTGPGLAVVAPGGDDDATVPSDLNCQPNRSLPPIRQLTFQNGSNNPRRFGYPSGYFGTSMSAAEVTATAALVIASGVVGRHPRPKRVIERLEQTAKPLDGQAVPNTNWGFGLIDAGAATARR